MAGRNSNHRPPDCPAWAWALIVEIRESNRQSAEDRKQAAEDRKEIRATLKSMDRTQQSLAETQHILAQDLFQMNDRLGGIGEVLHTLSTGIATLIVGQQEQTKLLHELLRAFRTGGNGRSGNGRPR